MINVRLDVTRFTKDLDKLGMRQVPYAAKLFVNQTALDIQQGERVNIASGRFTLRKTGWILNAVKIGKGDFATKERPIATVSMGMAGNPEAAKKEGLLAKFEDGGKKESNDPNFPIAVPSENLRKSFAELVPKRFFPKSLRLVERRTASGVLPAKRHVTRRGVVQVKGKLRTFVLDPKTMFGVSSWAVFQRIGSKRGDIRLLWRYKTRVPIPAILQFEETALRVVSNQTAKNWIDAFNKAMGSA